MAHEKIGGDESIKFQVSTCLQMGRKEAAVRAGADIGDSGTFTLTGPPMKLGPDSICECGHRLDEHSKEAVAGAVKVECFGVPADGSDACECSKFSLKTKRKEAAR